MRKRESRTAIKKPVLSFHSQSHILNFQFPISSSQFQFSTLNPQSSVLDGGAFKIHSETT